MTLLNQRDDLPTASKSFDALAPECNLIIIKEFPLLEPQQDFGVHTLEVTILRGMFEAQLLRLIQYIFHEIVFFGAIGTLSVSLLHRLVLLLFVDKGIFIIAVLVFFFIYLFRDRFLSWSQGVGVTFVLLSWLCYNCRSMFLWGGRIGSVCSPTWPLSLTDLGLSNAPSYHTLWSLLMLLMVSTFGLRHWRRRHHGLILLRRPTNERSLGRLLDELLLLYLLL